MGAFQGETMPIYQISTQSVQRLGSYRERLHTDIHTDRHTDRHFSGNGLNRLGGHQNGYIRRYLIFFSRTITILSLPVVPGKVKYIEILKNFKQ